MLLLAASAFAALPWLLHQNGKQPAFCDLPNTLQAQLEHGAFHGPRNEDTLALIPFTRVTFTRGPCYGDCPVYQMVLHRDGQIELLAGTHIRHRSSVSRVTVARVAQLLERAQSTATRREYMASWTDDFKAEIAVASPHGDWHVSDYGEVAPVEVWALEQVLHGIYLAADWKPQPLPR